MVTANRRWTSRCPSTPRSQGTIQDVTNFQNLFVSDVYESQVQPTELNLLWHDERFPVIARAQLTRGPVADEGFRLHIHF